MRIIDLLHQLSYSIAPGQCLLCDHLTGRQLDLCIACESDLPVLLNCCYTCSEPLQTGTQDALICSDCLRDPPGFSAVLCAFLYEHPIDHLIYRFKEGGMPAAGHVLTRLALRRLKTELQSLARFDPLVIPVPLHSAKQRRRGFNQTSLISGWLADSLSLTVEHRLLRRIRNTDSQRTLKAGGRRSNLSGAFRLTDSGAVKNRTVILVDDVVTTTSTAREISRVIMQGGAADVVVLTLARTSAARMTVW